MEYRSQEPMNDMQEYLENCTYVNYRLTVSDLLIGETIEYAEKIISLYKIPYRKTQATRDYDERRVFLKMDSDNVVSWVIFG